VASPPSSSLAAFNQLRSKTLLSTILSLSHEMSSHRRERDSSMEGMFPNAGLGATLNRFLPASQGTLLLWAAAGAPFKHVWFGTFPLVRRTAPLGAWTWL